MITDQWAPLKVLYQIHLRNCGRKLIFLLFKRLDHSFERLRVYHNACTSGRAKGAGNLVLMGQ